MKFLLFLAIAIDAGHMRKYPRSTRTTSTTVCWYCSLHGPYHFRSNGSICYDHCTLLYPHYSYWCYDSSVLAPSRCRCTFGSKEIRCVLSNWTIADFGVGTCVDYWVQSSLFLAGNNMRKRGSAPPRSPCSSPPAKNSRSDTEIGVD